MVSSDEEAHEEYLISRNLESVRKTGTKNFIKSMNDSEENLIASKQSARVASEASSGKR